MCYLLQANHTLIEEIREINQRLIDTVVDISNEDIDATAAAAVADGGEGVIIKCSFNAVSLSPGLKSQYGSAQLVGYKAFGTGFISLELSRVSLNFVSFYVVTNSTLADARSLKLPQLFTCTT